MTVINRYKQKGLTMLETVLAVAIGALIIMSVLMYYQTANDNANMAATIKITGDIGNAIRAYAQSPSYTGKVTLSNLQSAGLLTASDTVNPWSIQANSLKVSTSGNYLGISFYNVPATVVTTTGKNNKAGGICASLALQLTNSLPLPSPGTATLNGVTYTFTNPSTGGGINVTPTSPTKGPTQNAQGAAVCQLPTGATSTGTLSIVMDLT